MRRWKKVLLICLILATVGAISLAAAVRFLPESDLVRDHVRDALSDATGQNVSVGSMTVSLSLSNLLDLSLHGLSVTSKDGKPLVSADRIELSPTLRTLLERHISIRSVTIRGLHAFVWRQKDGTLEDLITGHQPSVRPEQTTSTDTRQPLSPNEATPGGKPETEPKKAGGKPALKLSWSVESINVVNARVDWIDRQILPGQEVRISLKKINGALSRKELSDTFSADFAGKLAGEGAQAGAVALSGTLTTAPDFSRLKSANITLSAKSLYLRIFREYIPPSARVGENFQGADGSAEMTWKEGCPARVSFAARMESKSDRSQLNVQATALTSNDFSSITEVEGTVETDLLPLKFLKDHLPPRTPIKRDQGIVKAQVEGRWSKEGAWRVSGNIGIEDAVPQGVFRQIASRVRIWVQASLDPSELALKNVEIADSAKLVSLTGTVTNPLSWARRLDLQGEVVLKPAWLKSLGVSAPKELVIKGGIPVRFVTQGKPEDLWVDLTGDLTKSDIRWAHFLEKPVGRRGTVSIRGKAHYRQESLAAVEIPGAVVSAGMNGAIVRIREEGPQLSDCAVQLDAKVAVKAGGPDITDATLAVRRGSGARALLLARANLTDVGSKSMAVHGTATATLDRTILALAGLEDESGVRVAGSAALQARFKGPQSAVDWSLEMPLSPLDVSVRDWIRKPGGVDGSLKASGKWTPNELALSYGQLSLPGVLVTARGILRDKNGKLQDLRVSTKNTRLEHLARFALPLQDKGLTGDADLSVRLSQREKEIVAHGTIRPISVDFAPKGSAVAVRQVRGRVETDGATLDVKELNGRLAGYVEGPINVQGKLARLGSVDALEGKLSATLGKGRINARMVRTLLSQANALLSTVLDPRAAGSQDSPLDFESASGTFSVHSGVAKTEDLKLKGPNLSLGAIGSLDLKAMTIDATVGVKTFTVVPAVLGKIPAVKKLVKEHEGWIKALGLDKELKRLGVDESAAEPNKTGSSVTRSPVTVIVKVHGPSRDPGVTPIMEAALKKETAGRLKELMN